MEVMIVMDRSHLKACKRIVVKVGTNTVMKSPSEIDYRKLDRLAYVLTELHHSGKEVILVTSGAIGVGASFLGRDTYPDSIPEQQALASVGQTALMNLYSRFFGYYSQNVGQILITRDVTDQPLAVENVRNNLFTLLDEGIIPIINENDAVSVDELRFSNKFGDNDTLSAIVGEIMEADLLIILSDVEGLYTSNPVEDPNATLIPIIQEINQGVYDMAHGKGSEFSSGGMTTKLKAAEIVMENDHMMVIMSGDEPSDIFDVLEGKNIGTLFANK